MTSNRLIVSQIQLKAAVPSEVVYKTAGPTAIRSLLGFSVPDHHE